MLKLHFSTPIDIVNLLQTSENFVKADFYADGTLIYQQMLPIYSWGEPK